jgi:hypothetical protein
LKVETSCTLSAWYRSKQCFEQNCLCANRWRVRPNAPLQTSQRTLFSGATSQVSLRIAAPPGEQITQRLFGVCDGSNRSRKKPRHPPVNGTLQCAQVIPVGSDWNGARIAQSNLRARLIALTGKSLSGPIAFRQHLTNDLLGTIPLALPRWAHQAASSRPCCVFVARAKRRSWRRSGVRPQRGLISPPRYSYLYPTNRHVTDVVTLRYGGQGLPVALPAPLPLPIDASQGWSCQIGVKEIERRDETSDGARPN